MTYFKERNIPVNITFVALLKLAKLSVQKFHEKEKQSF